MPRTDCSFRRSSDRSSVLKQPGSGLNLRQLILLSMLGALMFAAKMVLAPLPNVEPVTLITMLLASCFGWQGLIAVYIYAACEFFVWGIGLWSVSYLYVWLILFAAARAAASAHSRLAMALLAAVFGFFFGALCSLPIAAGGGWGAAFVWWQSGVGMDLIHGVSNFVLVFFLYDPLCRLLVRLKDGFDRSSPADPGLGKGQKK